jgi:predicted RNA-binding protein associated with RNAse of E/G family
VPTVEERKRKLDGRVQVYRCQGLVRGPRFALVRYRVQAEVALGGGLLRAPAGSWTYGLFWADRPYNVYLWTDAAGGRLGAYGNAAGETRIAEGAVEWLDLELDVLILPDGRVAVLDEELVPEDLRPELRVELSAARQALVASAGTVRAEAEALTRPFGVR